MYVWYASVVKPKLCLYKSHPHILPQRLSVCTWSEHLLSHKQVVETADVVPAGQEHQNGSFLWNKDTTQHLAADTQ